MKRNYLQPSSIVEAIETANLLDTIPLSPGYGDVEYAPSKLYEK